MHAAEVDTPWLTVEQATHYTGYDKRTLERYVRQGLLRRGGVPGGRRYHRGDLDAFMREQGLRLRGEE